MKPHIMMEAGSHEFEDAVFKEIRRQTPQFRGDSSRPGARFPSPVGLLYDGELTDAARRLGFTEENIYQPAVEIEGPFGVAELDRADAVLLAVMDLIDTGELVVIDRLGYHWVLPAEWRDLYDPEEVWEGVPSWAPRWWTGHQGPPGVTPRSQIPL